LAPTLTTQELSLPQRCTSSRIESLLCTRDMNVSSCFMDMAILQKGCLRPSAGVDRGSGPQALVRIC